MMKRVLALILVCALSLGLLCSCGKNTETTPDEPTQTTHQKVRFTMESGETFTIELYPEYAPETVDNFVKLVDDGFYNGLTFHRVMKGFMAQGGDPEGTGSGGSDTTIHGEFSANGFTQNTLSHTRGVVSMARNGVDMNSASSQFFICYDDATFLDGDYAAFGMVIDGMETVDNFLKYKIVTNAYGELSQPVVPIVIDKAEVVSE